MWLRWANAIYIMAICLTSPQSVKARCSCDFPQEWNGEWIDLSSGQSVEIDGSYFINFRCLQIINDKVLVKIGNHFQCIRVIKRSGNLLQYQEGDKWISNESDGLDFNHVCEDFPTNGVWHSLLDKNAQYISWGISPCDYNNFLSAQKGILWDYGDKYDFNYNRGRGECKNSTSFLEICEEKRITLSFGACPELGETGEEPFTYRPVASYTDSDNISYFIAKRERQRTWHCFAYKNTADGGHKLILSANASCSGLGNDEHAAGTTVVSLLKPPGCDFPKWITDVEKWNVSYDETLRYIKERNALLLERTAENGKREFHCVHSYNESPTEVKLLLRYACSPECTKFHYRSENFLEWQFANVEDCASENFDWKGQPFQGLLATNASVSSCPSPGLYTIPQGVLKVGCAAPHSVEFSATDDQTYITSGFENGVSCYASWSEGSVLHILTGLNTYQTLVYFHLLHDNQGVVSSIHWEKDYRFLGYKGSSNPVIDYRPCDAKVTKHLTN